MDESVAGTAHSPVKEAAGARSATGDQQPPTAMQEGEKDVPMKARRSTVLALMAASLVTGSAVGVAAHANDGVEYDPLSSIHAERGGYGNTAAPEYDPLSSIQVRTVDIALPGPIEFVGKWEFGEPLIPEASQTVAGITQNRGGVWRAVSEGMSDPRLDGTVTSAANFNIYPPAREDGPPVFAFNEVIRIENEDGAWQALPHVGFFSPGFSADDSMADWTIVMTGEGAYGGLSAIAYLDTGDGSIDVHGVILPSSHPPQPATEAQ
jgi:hypothetical protein